MTERAHAKLSASGSSRWLNCPGSVAAAEAYPDTSSGFADEGSVAHLVAETILRTDKAPDVGTLFPEYPTIPVTQEMIDFTMVYVDHVRQLSEDKTLLIEQKVDFSEWVPEGFGTVDALVMSRSSVGHIDVVDLKYGRGVIVEAEENTQLMLYALGALSQLEAIDYKVQTITLHIVQPRVDRIDSWDLRRDDLLAFGAYVQTRAELALADDAPRIPGDKQCQWCPAKARCPELKALADRIVVAQFDCEVDRLDDTALREAMDNKKLIESWLSAVSDLVKERLTSGGSFPGYKLVAGRSRRDWSDAEEAATALEVYLGDKTWERTLVSPAKAEKLLGRNSAVNLRELIAVSSGSPAVVPENDKRPPITLVADAEDFDF